MEEEYLEVDTEAILEDMADPDEHEIKGFRKTIADNVREILVESNPTLLLNNEPTLTVMLILNLYSSDPCSSCKELLSNVLKWSADNDGFANELRILILDASSGFDDKKIWDKLKISFNDVPLALFFDENCALVDSVQGVMSVNYLETFWSETFS